MVFDFATELTDRKARTTWDISLTHVLPTSNGLYSQVLVVDPKKTKHSMYLETQIIFILHKHTTNRKNIWYTCIMHAATTKHVAWLWSDQPIELLTSYGSWYVQMKWHQVPTTKFCSNTSLTYVILINGWSGSDI